MEELEQIIETRIKELQHILALECRSISGNSIKRISCMAALSELQTILNKIKQIKI